jgi:zona occludens toxin (predicted ATPase)
VIRLFTGTPGSGKSLDIAKRIFFDIRIRKVNIIANFEVNEEMLYKKCKKHGKFIYVSNEELTIKYLVKYAFKYHKPNKESQTVLIIDECQVIFNPREQKSTRTKWINFFSQHRKLGFDIILATQKDTLIDTQIRGQIEYECKHRKVNNFGIGMFLPFTLFVSVSVWYGLNEKMGSEFFVYRKKYGNLYNSFKMFDEELIFNEVEDEKQNKKKCKENILPPAEPPDKKFSSLSLEIADINKLV